MHQDREPLIDDAKRSKPLSEEMDPIPDLDFSKMAAKQLKLRKSDNEEGWDGLIDLLCTYMWMHVVCYVLVPSVNLDIFDPHIHNTTIPYIWLS